MLRRCVAVAVHVVVHMVSIAESAEFFSNAVFRITQIIQQIRLNARIDGVTSWCATYCVQAALHNVISLLKEKPKWQKDKEFFMANL